MGKSEPPLSKAEEIREATRAGNELLRDLRSFTREVKGMIESGFETYVSTCAREADKAVHAMLTEFADSLRRHSDSLQRAIMGRWQHIEAACMSDPPIANLMAMAILKKNGGSVQTKTGTWHLVKESREPDGSTSFAFPRQLTDRAEEDPRIDAAIRKTVGEEFPGLVLKPWASRADTESDEQ